MMYEALWNVVVARQPSVWIPGGRQGNFSGVSHPYRTEHELVGLRATRLAARCSRGSSSIIGGNLWIVQSVPPLEILGREDEA
jgi:hypothetical protein